MELRITKLINACLMNGKGMVVIIGDTYTGKTFIANKILKKLEVNIIPYDFDLVPKGIKGVKGIDHPLVKRFQKHKGPKITNFFDKGSVLKSKDIPKSKEVLFCDALETYSSSVLTFLKNVAELLPVIVTCDRSVIIPKTSNIERVWWNGKKRIPTDWEGDPILNTPRDLFISLTQRRTRVNKAIRNFGSDSFILTQYYHDEFPLYKKATLDDIVNSTSALSMIDAFRVKEWESNGFLSITPVSEEIFVRRIRSIHKNPCLVPKGFFPKTLSKGGKITRNQLEIANIETALPNIREKISIFNSKIGKSFLYKKEANRILSTHKNEKDIENYSRALELTGNKPLTKTEIKKLKLSK